LAEVAESVQLTSRVCTADEMSGSSYFRVKTINRTTCSSSQAKLKLVDRSLVEDGNLINMGARQHVWNIKDRLAVVSENGVNLALYRYDAFGRRISRSMDPDAYGVRTIRYLYERWNVVAEYETQPGDHTGTADLKRRNIWGPDVSGSFQGAGGVGGLLMVENRESSPTKTLYYAYDGNGNVACLFEQNELWGWTEVAATYAYDPFGRLAYADGPAAEWNKWRFSTKIQDDETGWNYYGYRYYDAVAGRWVNRDPIWERGGINLYGMVGNDAVNRWDYLGLLDLNLFPNSGKDKEICCSANKAGNNEKDKITVGGHGNPSGMIDSNGNPLSADKLAGMIKANPKFASGSPILLASCNTGGDAGGSANYAQQLANATGRTVYAPNAYVAYYPDGQTTLTKDATAKTCCKGKDDGNYLRFEPQTSTSPSPTSPTQPTPQTPSPSQPNPTPQTPTPPTPTQQTPSNPR
jgi:RHS repeat-associated protein